MEISMKGFFVMVALIIIIVLGIAGFYTFQTPCAPSSTPCAQSNNSIFGNFGKHEDKEVSVATYPFSVTGLLSINTKNGNISVVAHNKQEIIVTTIKQGNKDDFEKIHSKATFTKETGSLQEIYDHTTNTNFSCDASISYEINVPTSINITAESKNGSLALADTSGTIIATTQNGSLHCKNITGPCTAESKNGNILLADIKGTVLASTQNGTLDCKNITGPSTIKSKNGNVTLIETTGLTSAETLNGTLTIKSEKLLSNKNAIKLESKNGSIIFEVKDIEKNRIELMTTNGQINIKVTEPQVITDTPQCISLTTRQAFLQAYSKNGHISVKKF